MPQEVPSPEAPTLHTLPCASLAPAYGVAVTQSYLHARAGFAGVETRSVTNAPSDTVSML